MVASDDAAGLAVANGLQADITTLQQGARNALQGRAVMQTADGALSRVGDILQRMKSLASQALSGSVDDTGRGFIQQEYDQLLTEIGDIATQTEFNGTTLLDGASFNESFLVGVNSGDTIDVDLTTATGDDINVTAIAGTLTAGTSLTTDTATTQGEMDAVDAAIDDISAARATVGSYISRFEYRGEYIETAMENLSAAKSSIMDVDIAAEQTNLVNKQVLTEASIAALAQANQSKSSLLSLLR